MCEFNEIAFPRKLENRELRNIAFLSKKVDDFKKGKSEFWILRFENENCCFFVDAAPQKNGEEAKLLVKREKIE